MHKSISKHHHHHKHTRCISGINSRVLCCTCSRQSSEEEEEESDSSSSSSRYPVISSIAHAMVQERLDQMIRERRVEPETKFVVMVAMEKTSRDPREDFRESMMQMIVENGIRHVKDLRRLLNYYVTMNAEEFRGVILEVFHDVCDELFLRCSRY